MLILALTFAVVLAIIMGMYWAFVVRPEQATQRILHRRLHPAKVITTLRLGLLKEAHRLSGVPSLNRLLACRTPLVAPVQRVIDQSGLGMTVGTFLLASGCLFMFALLVVRFLTHTAWPALPAGVLAASLPYAYVRRERQKRVRRFEALFPEALDLVTRALRAGHAFTTGLAMVAEEMPEPIAHEFRLLYEHQNFGLPLPEALKQFAERLPLVDARFFATAVLTQREAGGNLSEVLENLAGVMRDRFTVLREVRVKSAHGRISGFVLMALPPAVAGVLSIINPNHIGILIHDPLGIRLLVGAAILQIVGTLIIRKIINFDY